VVNSQNFPGTQDHFTGKTLVTEKVKVIYKHIFIFTLTFQGSSHQLIYKHHRFQSNIIWYNYISDKAWICLVVEVIA